MMAISTQFLQYPFFVWGLLEVMSAQGRLIRTTGISYINDRLHIEMNHRCYFFVLDISFLGLWAYTNAMVVFHNGSVMSVVQ